MNKWIILAACIGFLTVGSAAVAGDEIDKALKNVETQEITLLKDVTPAGHEQFEKIRAAHGTLRAVEDVQAALDRAIKNCTQAHKVQAFGFQNQFQAWKNAVLPVVRQGQNRLDKMILTQNFATPAAVQSYLTAYTAAVTVQKKGIKDVPVSDLDACQAMVDQLKETQTTMAGMIKETIGLE